MPRQRARNWAVPSEISTSGGFPRFAHRASAGRRSRRIWVLGSEQCFGTQERVLKLRKGILERIRASLSCEYLGSWFVLLPLSVPAFSIRSFVVNAERSNDANYFRLCLADAVFDIAHDS